MSSDRRTHPRKPVTTAYLGAVRASSGELLGLAIPADVSEGGFRADASRAYSPGETLRLEVHEPHQMAGRQIGFAIAWSARFTDGWQFGGRFTERLSEEEVETLSSPR